MALLAVLAASIVFTGCAKKPKRAQHPRKAPVARIGSTEKGVASWYGIPYHGRRAANGEIYDMEKLTAAHRTLPFNTWVEVENLDNGKRVTVRITDRGPFIDGRIIDLSKAAARDIDMIGPGLAHVRLKIVEAPKVVEVVSAAPVVVAPVAPEVVEPVAPAPTVESGPRYGVQVGAFQDRVRAEALRKRYESEYGSATMVPRQGRQLMWRVMVGSTPTIEEADQLRVKLMSAGVDGFVVMLDAVVVTK